MENAEEILQCLDEFSKLRPKEIPPELEYYLSFVARTGDPVYQWPVIKCLFREKLINVITEFYEACPSVEIPPCPNVEVFNYEAMKTFILEKLDTFAAAPFTVQRISELLTSPRKEYNRIDKYMRALEKNILVVSTREPGSRKSTENGESIVNGLESEHMSQEMVISVNSDINVEVDMEEKTVWQKSEQVSYAVNESSIILEAPIVHAAEQIQESYVLESKPTESIACSSTAETVIASRLFSYAKYNNEMIVEPSTNLSNNETPTPQITECNEVPESITVFNMNSTTTEQIESKEGHVYIKPLEQSELAYIKPDCTKKTYTAEAEPSLVQMEPVRQLTEQPQIISETEIEPITPPEPVTPPEPEEHPEESSPQPQEQPTEAVTQSVADEEVTQEPESSTVEPESSVTVVFQPEEKQPEELSNETTISSSNEMPQPSDDTQPQILVVQKVTAEAESAPENPEISGSSDTQENEVSESNIESEFIVTQTEETQASIVIGPEDMQVEDISPEPTENSPANVEIPENSLVEVTDVQNAGEKKSENN